jgi:hypothetical protein
MVKAENKIDVTKCAHFFEKTVILSFVCYFRRFFLAPLRKFLTILLRVGGGSGESEAASYGRLHEKDARKKLEQILGLQIAEAKKVVDKGRRMKLKLI